MFNRKRRNLRGSIFTSFSVLLFISFGLMGGIFNVLVGQYIRQSAISELAEAEALYLYMERFITVTRSGLFGQRISNFYMDENYVLLDGHITPSAAEIADAMMEQGIVLTGLHNRRLRTDDGIFYVSARPAMGERQGWYTMFYVDITDISRFSNQVNMILLILVVVIWLLSIIITTFLAGSLAHPLLVLTQFARRIGKNDFTLNPESFANEEFEALNQSLNQTARQLAKYDNEQKTFFQNASHELRTPLMSIKSYAEGIKYGIMDAQSASNTILEATDRLTNMVGDLLYISRIDNIDTPQEHEIDLRQLVVERLRLYESLRSDLTIQIQQDERPVIIECAQPYIERALDNIIANALRYAKATLLVECYAVGARGVVRITDDGPGFNPDDLPHIFERFYHGENGQTGLGLAIVKSIVEQHDGTVTAINKEKGAAVIVSLPRTGK